MNNTAQTGTETQHTHARMHNTQARMRNTQHQNTQTQTHIHTHIHTYMHTHAHIHSPSLSPSLSSRFSITHTRNVAHLCGPLSVWLPCHQRARKMVATCVSMAVKTAFERDYVTSEK